MNGKRIEQRLCAYTPSVDRKSSTITMIVYGNDVVTFNTTNMDACKRLEIGLSGKYSHRENFYGLKYGQALNQLWNEAVDIYNKSGNKRKRYPKDAPTYEHLCNNGWKGDCINYNYLVGGIYMFKDIDGQREQIWVYNKDNQAYLCLSECGIVLCNSGTDVQINSIQELNEMTQYRSYDFCVNGRVVSTHKTKKEAIEKYRKAVEESNDRVTVVVVYGNVRYRICDSDNELKNILKKIKQ